MAAAAEWVLEGRERAQKRQGGLRDRLWKRIAAAFPRATQNGDPNRRLANTLNVSFAGESSETILMALDLEGVCASSGSACMVGSVVASHVLLAMGLPVSLASSAVRFSLGHDTTEDEIDRSADAVKRILGRLVTSREKSSEKLHATV
jgi:cysteine desulfurase